MYMYKLQKIMLFYFSISLPFLDYVVRFMYLITGSLPMLPQRD